MTDREKFTVALLELGVDFDEVDSRVRIDVGHNDVRNVNFVFDAEGKFVKVFM